MTVTSPNDDAIQAFIARFEDAFRYRLRGYTSHPIKDMHTTIHPPSFTMQVERGPAYPKYLAAIGQTARAHNERMKRTILHCTESTDNAGITTIAIDASDGRFSSIFDAFAEYLNAHLETGKAPLTLPAATRAKMIWNRPRTLA